MADTTVPLLLGDQSNVAAQYRNLGSSQFAPVVAPPTDWSVTHNPAVNTTATATKAAGGAGVRHVCTSIHATMANSGGAAVVGSVVLRDGAAGAGAILWSGEMAVTAVAGDYRAISISGLNIVGSPNTAMTLEFQAGPGANMFQSVALTGYDAG